MYVNSKFTDNREVTHQDYDDYVFRTATGRGPYGDLSGWEGVDSDEYLTHGNLTDTDGNGTSVGFHTVSGNTHSGMESNRLVPAVWHTAINPYVILSGYTMGGGILYIHGGDLSEDIFEYISHWQFKFRDGAQFRCDVFSGYLFGSEGDEVDLSQFDMDNAYSYASWYSGNTSVNYSQVSAHGDLSSVTYTGYEIQADMNEIDNYDVLEEAAFILVRRGNKQKWYRVSERTPVVFGISGITAADVLGFNDSGQSKYDFNIQVSFEPEIELTMIQQTFNFPWTWRIIYDSAPHPNHGTIQFRLDNSYGNSTYASKSIPTSATTRSVISGVTTVQISNSYQGQSFTFNWIGAVTGYTSSTAVTNYYLTTGGTMTTLYLNKNPQYVRFTGEIQIEDTIGMYNSGYNNFTVYISPDGCGDNQRNVDYTEIYDGNSISIADYDDSYLIPGSSITITVECNVHSQDQMGVLVTVNENKNVGATSLTYGDTWSMQVMATASNSFRLDGTDCIYLHITIE